MIVLFYYGEFGREFSKQSCYISHNVSVLSGTATWLSEECGLRNKTTYLKLSTKRLEDNPVRGRHRLKKTHRKKWKDVFAELLDRGDRKGVDRFEIDQRGQQRTFNTRIRSSAKGTVLCGRSVQKQRTMAKDHAKGTGWKHQFVGSCCGVVKDTVRRGWFPDHVRPKIGTNILS